MANAGEPQRDDGVTLAPGVQPWRKRAWLGASVALLVAALWFALPRQRESEDAERAARPPDGSAPSEPQSPETAAAPPQRADAGAPSRAQAEREPADEAPQQLDADSVAGVVPSGIGLYPPPGTDPVKIGIVVPEDFALPEGYLRHYQVTDDGQSMPAILLFHPDYVLLDESGEPVALPKDRVVPPELAPPGLPIEMLVPPPPRTEAGAP
jgi:hypothetical protein